MKNNYTVYKHTSPSGKSYIGITNNYSRRCWEHKYNAKNGYTFTFYRAIRNYSWEAFKHEIVTDNITKAEAIRIEALLIKELNTLVPNGYNMLSGSEGFACPEDRRKCRIDKRKDTVKGYSYYKNKYKVCLSYLGKRLCFGTFIIESDAKERADYLMSLNDSDLLIEHAEYMRIQKAKVKGYYFDIRRNKWKVRLHVNGKKKSFGYYPTEQDAINKVEEILKHYQEAII